MGDRGNIVVRAESKNNLNDVWLYSHWGGTELPVILKAALARGKNRWDDPPYLTRIIFCQMVQQQGWNDQVGFGIGARMGDNEHLILVVDTEQQKVFTIEESKTFEGRAPANLSSEGVPFEEFITRKEEETA